LRVQDHLKLSTAAALIALPWLKQDAWIPVASSVLIDVDHYLWYAAAHRTLSMRAALRYFHQANPTPQPWARSFHHPLFLALIMVIAARTRSKWLWLILYGLLFHVSLDVIHGSQMNRLKRTLREQACGTCSACGQPSEALELHTRTFARNIFDRYNAAHFVMLCPDCHVKAHQK
jgi:hypothetical protein